jgi:hypothetical protein
LLAASEVLIIYRTSYRWELQRYLLFVPPRILIVSLHTESRKNKGKNNNFRRCGEIETELPLKPLLQRRKTMLHAEDPTSADRVRHSTAADVNREIDRQTNSNIRRYANSSEEVINRRIEELDKEWDVERALEVNASTLALTGLLLGVTINRKWLVLPGVVLSFLLQHGLQGWCPPLPLLRRLGVRTRSEIDREKYELKALLEGR